LPSALHEQSGAYKKNPKRRNKLEPKVPLGHPHVPDTVSSDPVALQRWNELCRDLEKIGVLTELDMYVLEAQCMDYSLFIRTVEEMNSIHPETDSYLANMMNKLQDRMLRRMTELGLTPSSRTKIQVKPQEEVDPLQDWLKARAAV
jgi:P27 family predicted phage terminase small subunit